MFSTIRYNDEQNSTLYMYKPQATVLIDWLSPTHFSTEHTEFITELYNNNVPMYVDRTIIDQ